jgi:glycosyltransferase involved in cell wall biosynthesis
VQAVAASEQLRTNFTVVCFGGGKFDQEETGLLHQLGYTPEQCIQLEGDDTMLAALYAQATALIYPSLYEGFGLPILEAMACHCPVVCGNTGSMPEVAGSAANYFDPLSSEEMTAVMEETVFSPETMEKLKKLGDSRHRQFSWQKCARETQAVYDACLESGA